MSENSKIEWTDATWNPIVAIDTSGKVGFHCEKVSPACKNCYAETFNKRCLPARGTGVAYSRIYRDHLKIAVDEKTLNAPYGWKKPKKIFVCSMTDLFGEWVPFELIDDVMATIYELQWHTFQVLTKRPERMLEYFQSPYLLERIAMVVWKRLQRRSAEKAAFVPIKDIVADLKRNWPMRNLWLGVTAENQEWADVRIPLLLASPAAIRFVSYEPALGPIDLTCVGGEKEIYEYGSRLSVIPLEPHGGPEPKEHSIFLDWVICGGESGNGARPMHPDWARTLKEQCEEAGVPFFFKQWGEYIPLDVIDIKGMEGGRGIVLPQGGQMAATPGDSRGYQWLNDNMVAYRAGKVSAGRLLDGVEHNGMPEVAR